MKDQRDQQEHHEIHIQLQELSAWLQQEPRTTFELLERLALTPDTPGWVQPVFGRTALQRALGFRVYPTPR